MSSAASAAQPTRVGHRSARGHRASPFLRARGGAYGLRVDGADIPAGQLVGAPAHWQSVELRVRVAPAPRHGPEHVGDRSAKLNVRAGAAAGGTVEVDRVAGRATFTLPSQPTPSALVHPHLAVVGAVWAHWSSREAFHAGAFVADGAVWALLGAKGSGKSSMLAALARAGTPIVCDDVLVLDRSSALAGPRSIDLRADAAERLDMGESLGTVGERERWRVPLEPIAPELPFRGWVALRWSERPAVRRLLGADRLGELLEHRALRVPPRVPAASMELASLPFLELCRPRRWSTIDDAVERLLSALSG